MSAIPEDICEGSRREREVFRYAEALVTLDVQPWQSGQVAVSSQDRSLTALAQLVALRLDAKRAFISLIDEHNHYFLAEATRTLSLQSDKTHGVDDGLYLGATVLPRRGDFFCQTLNQWTKLQAKDQDVALLFVPDLQRNEKYAQCELVADGSHASYAGLPLIAPSGYAIGALSLLDDKPRPGGLTAEESVFLRDVATTVVSHLELLRTRKAYSRGLRMAHGLGRFTEGKESVDDFAQPPVEHPKDLQDRQTVHTAKLGASDRTRAMNDATNIERVDDELRKHLGTTTRHSSPATTVQMHDTLEREARNLNKHITNSRLEAGRVQSPQTQPDIQRRTSNIHDTSAMADIQEDLLSKDVRVSFERAAKIITEALDLSGMIFLDASIGEFGKMRTVDESSSAQDTTDATTSAASDRDSKIRRNAPAPAKPDSKVCRLLASAYDKQRAPGSTLHKGVPETFLKTLMRHYPYGKVWNFDSDGNASSGSENTDRGVGKPSVIGEKRRRRKRSDHGRLLQELFPEARSLGLMPMWDAQRQRFFAGTIVWSYERTRVLSFQDDMNYLGAFCDVIMAEVARLDAQQEAKTKKSFLSSISHELKTPLHGILGAVECLLDGETALLRTEMVQMIDASARSLLDIVQNLIAHADSRSTSKKDTQMYSAQRNNERVPRVLGAQRRKQLQSLPEEPSVDLSILTEEVLDIALWATPQPSPLPGGSEAESSHPHAQTSGSPLKVILDIDRSVVGSKFHVNAGAWRRILLNLTSNSIKYTDRGGYLKLTLTMLPADPTDVKSRPIVELVCVDSGRGMSQQYQDQGLWQAFSKEDSHSLGTGLGLSLIRGIVHEMGGTVEIKSTKDVGTEVRILAPLSPASIPNSPVESPDAVDIQRKLTDPTYMLLGFDSQQGINDREQQADEALQQSVERTCRSLGFRPVTEVSGASVCITSEQRAGDLVRSGQYQVLGGEALRIPVIVLCHSVVSARDFTLFASQQLPLVKAVSQPFGPRKLLRALVESMEKRRSLPSEPPSEPERRLEQKLEHGDRPRSPPASPKTQIQEPTSQGAHTASAGVPMTGVVQQTQPQSALPTTNLKPKQSSSDLCVLLVDDNTLNIRLLETYMKKLGHQYIKVVNGQEAVESFREFHDTKGGLIAPTMLILMDVTMPVMDGFEATRQIRRHERTIGIEASTIVALTAMNTAEARQEAFSSGVNTFMTKPVRFKDISALVTDHLERYKDDGCMTIDSLSL